MKQLADLARRHVSKLVYAVAVVGVPVAVVYGTGGLHTIGFWAKAVLWLPLSLIGLMPFSIFIIFGLAPILFILDKLFPRRLEKILDMVMAPVWGMLTLVVYALSADLGYTGDVWLPTPWPNVGALLVMAVASASVVGLMWLGGALEVPRPHRAPTYISPWDGIPEPNEEFWSGEKVEGWRAWRWDGGRLRGVYAAWRSSEYVATCNKCREVPGWSHTCGIYAVKDPRSVHRFHNETEVIGRVEMWGNVIEHEHGYRTQNARITDLWVQSESLAPAIEARYRVDVHVGAPQSKEVSAWPR